MYALPGKINNVFLYATRIVSQRRGMIAVNTCLDQAYMLRLLLQGVPITTAHTEVAAQQPNDMMKMLPCIQARLVTVPGMGSRLTPDGPPLTMGSPADSTMKPPEA